MVLAAAMTFEDWLFWVAFLGFVGCNAALLIFLWLR
jgi:hypothetical protein